MALDKVLSTSIAEGAVTAAAISNTANLVVGSISANGADLISSISIGNSTVNAFTNSTGIFIGDREASGQVETNLVQVSLGGTYSNTAGSANNAKLKLYEANNGTMGISISNAKIDYIAEDSNWSHNFYTGGNLSLNLNYDTTSYLYSSYSRALRVSSSNINAGYLEVYNSNPNSQFSYLALTTTENETGYLIKNNARNGNALANNSLYLWNANGPIEMVPNANIANRATLSSTGIFQAPKNPVFHAEHNNTEALNAGQIFTAWTSVTNVGFGFSSGRVTVPVAGRYFISASLLRSYQQSPGGIYLTINGTNVLRIIYVGTDDAQTGGVGAYTMGSGQAIYSLAASDYIELKQESSGVAWYGDTMGLGNFTVFLVS